MPGRSLLSDFRPRNDTICRTCLLTLRQRLAPQAQTWTAPLSQMARARLRARARAQGQAQAKPQNIRDHLPPELIEQLEQIKATGGSQEPQNYDVRFFEQNDVGNGRTEMSNESSFAHSLSGVDASGFKDSLLAMKGVMGTKREQDAFAEVMSEMGIDWDQLRSPEDIENMMSRMDDYTASIDAQMEATIAQLPEDMREGVMEQLGPLMPGGQQRYVAYHSIPQIPLQSWTANQRKKISKLNTVIQRIWREMRGPGGLTNKHVTAVYRSYHAARRSLAHSWSSVPVDVWDFLWTVFSADESINIHRLSHLSLLARDMGDAKVALSPAQQLLTIEAMFVDGWEAKAQENWKRCVATLGDESAETFKDYWELGVRMYCRTGDMERAERATEKLLDKESDPRILMPIIRTYCERGSPEDREKAWLAYRRLRELLGQNMKLTDYDQIVSYFLTTNQTENALYAFVDMMSDGQIDLKKQKYMPSVVANKFFLGKWLKRLIGAGDLDGAYSVVEFMRHKGVQAAPIHLNGLIGAWQRSGGADNTEKAEALAWKMIKARIEFVKARKAGTINHSFKAKVASLPRATLETFSILAENYRLRDLHEQMAQLWDAFRDAEISPDAFMMNQLLESHIQAGQVKEALELYQSLLERGVQPDPYTFSALWKTLGINRLHHIPDGALEKEADAARQLFAETAKFRPVFAESMDGQLARKILHTFRRLRDNAGFLVALTSLKQMFGFLPSETLVLEMILGTTRLSWDSAPNRRRLMVAKRNMDNELMEWADNDASKLEGDQRGVALHEYLQKKFWPADSEEEWGKVFIDVAKQMGVYDTLVGKKGGRRRR